MARVGVCLSGCGFKDGAEIHESVLTLLALDQAGAEAVCCAPDVEQAAVVNHLTGEPVSSERRNVLQESARIARGNIRDVRSVRAAELDALILPGGFGAAKNLSTFADDGPECRVNTDVERLVGEMLDARKPVGAICIAPALLARVLGRKGIAARLTIGTDAGTAKALERMGVQHQDAPCTTCVTDAEHRVVSTPAYMLGKGPAEVFEGIRSLVGEVLRLAKPASGA